MPPIIALDFPDFDQAKQFLRQFSPSEELVVKIGMELVYAEGPQLMADIEAVHPAQVFLDLKLHDIPHTVEQAAFQLGRLGAAMTTVHAAGGSAMIQAAKRGLLAGAQEAGKAAPRLLAVTQLTSTSQEMLNNELQIPGTPAESVVHLAKLAAAAGADGVIASPLEASLIRAAVGGDFLIVTPGIRPAGAAIGDQKRVTTPGDAKRLGSSAIVVGRPITQSADPVAAYHAIAKEWSEA
ncbi:orotidine-5'-phosphate decarboxylase [Lacticaseibacillus yichunensis]|uniref:Orotidine 5'-phosphate decarboxylase n=1 Tax=Lacticaseibacillus yichunensis TaxID=2486015 RepID=A0ABW4CRM3_9LACO|nr:orotidine-5'-phosphate decarboxylase [Lacticaseibacillus yichunensis]